MTYLETAIIALVLASIGLQFIMMRIMLKFMAARLQDLDSIMADALVNAIDTKIELLSGDIEPPNPWAALATEFLKSRMPMGTITEVIPKDETGKFISQNR